jgi:hypothetical protein
MKPELTLSEAIAILVKYTYQLPLGSDAYKSLNPIKNAIVKAHARTRGIAPKPPVKKSFMRIGKK